MKKRSSLWYLGFLSFLCLLYFEGGNPGFFGFLTFVPYFVIYRMGDERIEANVGKATRNAFLFSAIAGSMELVYIRLAGLADAAFVDAFVALFTGSLMVCLLSLVFYEALGK
jgi:hypothetical protein